MQAPGIESTPILFGDTGLFGIRTSPAGPAASIGVIILNAGMVPSVGPFRMNLLLADALGELGITTVRLDQSGKGESPVRSSLTPAEAVLLDYDEVLANLQRSGITSTIVMGLCSGAVDALHIADERESVVGLVLLDGYIRQTPRWYVTRYVMKVRTFVDKLKYAVILGPRRAINRYLSRRDSDSDDISRSMMTDIRDWGTLDLRPGYARVLSRGVKILSIFSGTFYPYNYAGQLTDFLAPVIKTSKVREVFYAEANHTYTLSRHRSRLISTIRNWIAAEYPDEVEVN